MMNLEGKIALVTGASRGIGHAIALDLAKHGATVIGTATSEQGAEKFAQTMAEANLAGSGIIFNAKDDASIESAFANAQEKAGKIDILVNNAAINCDNLLLRMKDQEWQDVMQTNLTAVFKLSKLCLKGMLKARWGRIINISSVVGYTGNPGQANYAAAKAGLVGFTKSLAYEVATRNITANLIAPGFIETDMTNKLTDEQKTAIFQGIPMQRLGQPQDIAAAAVFLASPAANYITGQTIHVNGGMFMA